MNTQEQLDILDTQIENLERWGENNKNFTGKLADTLIELLGILHKATNTPQFEKMRNDLIQSRGEHN